MKIIILIFLFLNVFSSKTFSEENFYYVYDTKSNLKEEFKTYSSANRYYKQYLDDYDNLVLAYNDQVLKMEYGVLAFKNDDDYINYYSLTRDKEDYFNVNPSEALYLNTSDDGKKVYFYLANDKGYISVDEVILYPFESLKTNISTYQNIAGELVHKHMSQLEYNYYSSAIVIDKAYEALSNNLEYYSYDGHYFYDDFYLMSDDYRNNTREHAVNEEAYYNYYQFLTYRSLTNYNYEELENYFYKNLGLNRRLVHYFDYNLDNANDDVNCSELYQQIDKFFLYQYLYGTNAMLLLSGAIEDSNFGKSLNAYLYNNLFANAAFETNVEKENSRYLNIERSIYSYSKYLVSNLYANHFRSDYYGTYYGNKLSGINVEHNLDPFYGERVASRYYQIDKSLGFKDYHYYQLGVIKDLSKLTLYKDAKSEERFYYLNNVKELVFLILDEDENRYKVQLDDSYNENFFYDFNSSVAYIDKEDFTYLINDSKPINYEFKELNYDFNEGTFNGKNKLTLKINKDENVFIIIPNKEGYEFINYDNEDNNLRANYKKIVDIKTDFNFSNKDKYPYLDLLNKKMEVIYDDNSKNSIELNSDYVDVLKNKEDIIINYCGYEIVIPNSKDEEYVELINKFQEALKSSDYEFIKEHLEEINCYLSMNDIRKIDDGLKTSNRHYVLNDKLNLDISFSGLNMSLKDYEGFDVVRNSYYLNIDRIDSISYAYLTKLVKDYGFDVEYGLNLSFKFNYQDISLKGPIIIQTNKIEKNTNRIYSVYHLDKNANIIKCRTTQSKDYLKFVAYEEGDYLVISLPSINNYDIDDLTEIVNETNLTYDNHALNITFMLFIFVTIISFLMIGYYYLIKSKKEKMWKDYKKSLHKQVFVQEEKPKN